MDNKICLYHFLDHEGEPFYVGVTNNFRRRKNEHNMYVRKQKKWAVYNKINQLIRDHSYLLRMEIIKSELTKEEANLLEIETIKQYKEVGIKLYNMSDGGEGIVGHKPEFTDEWRKNLSQGQKNRIARDGVPFKGCKHSEESKKKIRDNQPDMSGEKNPFFGKTHTEENKEKSRVRAKKLFSELIRTKEHCRKIGVANKGRKYSEEQNKNNSDLRKKEALEKAKTYKITTPEGEEILIKNTLVGISLFLKEKYQVEAFPQSIGNVIKGKIPCLKFYPLWKFEIYLPNSQMNLIVD